MKIGIFTDSHYSSAEVTCGVRYNSRSLDKIRYIYSHFEEEGCDLVCCLGDLIDHDGDHEAEISNLTQIAQIIKASSLQTVCLMGNHDGFTFTVEEFYQILGQECRQEVLKIQGKTLIFPDTCYFKTGFHYMPGDADWTDTFLPEVNRLAEMIRQAPGDVYLFLHQNVDAGIEQSHRLYNDEAVRTVIEESGKVKAVFQGHYHPGYESQQNGVKYITFPAVCEREDAYYVIEI